MANKTDTATIMVALDIAANWANDAGAGLVEDGLPDHEVAGKTAREWVAFAAECRRVLKRLEASSV